MRQRWGKYRLALHKDDLVKHRALLKELMATVRADGIAPRTAKAPMRPA